MKESRTLNVDAIGPVLFEHSFRAGRIVITVRPQKGVRVAVPGRATFDSALEFVTRKKRWIQKQLEHIEECNKHNLALSGSFAAIGRDKAKRILETRLRQLAEKHGFTYNRVSLRNQQTRWGSCSRKNNISLNLKLAVLPEELVDYVIMHELVHTRIHDHSRGFWSELDKYVGSGKAMATQLRNYDTRWI